MSRLRWAAALVGMALVATATYSVERSTAAPSFNGDQVPQIDGWRADFSEDFTAASVNDQNWGPYGWGYQPVGNGAMGVYRPENTTISNGTLNLTYAYRDGQWTSAGVSGAPLFTAAGGRWEFRVRQPRAAGLGYAFLLWPAGDKWPPEIDIAEGNSNSRTVSSFYHFRTADGRERLDASRQVDDPWVWNTYGVIIEADELIFTHNGEPHSRIALDTPEKRAVVSERMWIGFQIGVMDPNAPEAEWFETVKGGVPNAETPASGTVQIDWVAHYVRDPAASGGARSDGGGGSRSDGTGDLASGDGTTATDSGGAAGGETSRSGSGDVADDQGRTRGDQGRTRGDHLWNRLREFAAGERPGLPYSVYDR